MSQHTRPDIPNQTPSAEWGPRQKTAETKRLRTRSALLAAADTLFRAPGYQATTMEDLAAEAGVSTASAFNYFSKTELATTLIDTRFARTGTGQGYLDRHQDFFVAERILGKTVDQYPRLGGAALLRLIEEPNYTDWLPETYGTLLTLASRHLESKEIAATFSVQDPTRLAGMAIAGAVIHPILAGDSTAEYAIYMTDQMIRPHHQPYPYDQLTSNLVSR